MFPIDNNRGKAGKQDPPHRHIKAFSPNDDGNAGCLATHTHKLEGRAGAEDFCWRVAIGGWQRHRSHWSACLFLPASPSHEEE